MKWKKRPHPIFGSPERQRLQEEMIQEQIKQEDFDEETIRYGSRIPLYQWLSDAGSIIYPSPLMTWPTHVKFYETWDGDKTEVFKKLKEAKNHLEKLYE